MPNSGRIHGPGDTWGLQSQSGLLSDLNWGSTSTFAEGNNPDLGSDGGSLHFDSFNAPDYQQVAQTPQAGRFDSSHVSITNAQLPDDFAFEEVQQGQSSAQIGQREVSVGNPSVLKQPLRRFNSTSRSNEYEGFHDPAVNSRHQQQQHGPAQRPSPLTSPPQYVTSCSTQPTFIQSAAQTPGPNARKLNSSPITSRANNWPKPPLKSPPASAPPQKRREISKSTAVARQMYSSPSTFQPNEEEEIRRMHFGQLPSRADSVASNISGKSRGAHDYTKVDNGGDESRIQHTGAEIDVGHGFIPGVVRSPEEGDPGLDAPEGSLSTGKGFTIQVGSETFKLSGASIMSDAPSYFSNFFSERLKQRGTKNSNPGTLFVDRDPETFRDICRHLQGYIVQPQDAGHFVRLFVDAQFFSLARLISLLFDSETFISIGGENFTLPRDIFSGIENTPNYFSLGFAVFFDSPDGPFPGLDARTLLRPPPVKPPSVPGRSARVFTDILHLLRGYTLTIRDENHRAELLRDCRYFNLRGLEQRIISHHISYNASRGTSEIIIRLEDIRQSGISFMEEVSPSLSSPLGGWVHYARPFVDDTSHELIIEIDDEAAKIDFRSMRIIFYEHTKARISKLFQVIANKMNLPVTAPLGLMMATGGAAAQEVSPGNTPLSEDRVKINLGQDAHIVLDGEDFTLDSGLADIRYQYEEEFGHESINSPMVERNLTPSAPTSASTTAAPSMWPTTSLAASQPRISSPARGLPPSRKRRRRGSLDDFGEWLVRKAQWKLLVRPRADASRMSGSDTSATNGTLHDKMEIVLCAVKLEAFSGQRGRNMQRGFLS